MRSLRSTTIRRSRPLRLDALDERALPSGFHQTNLVANEPGVALVHDPALVNAWGISLSPTAGAFWLSAHGTGVSPLYVGDVNGSPFAKAALTVNIPDGAPTGQVFNGSGDFRITNGTQTAPARFIFAGEDGTITGWNPAVPPITQARIAVDTDGEARYTGLAIANTTTNNRLYAADLANGEIDVFDSTFAAVDLGDDAFVDPRLPRHFAPFNVQNLGGTLYVTYARTDRGPDIDDLKGGVVNAFDLDGNFLRRIATQGKLNAPWGLALAPEGFGNLGGALLVGNHGNGRINAFDPETGQFLGKVREEGHGRPVRIDGLFGLAFGNGISAGDTNALYFAAGPDGGEDGLFGSLRFVADAPSLVRGLRTATGSVSMEGITSLTSPAGTTTTTALPAMTSEIDWSAIYLEATVDAPQPSAIDSEPTATVSTMPTETEEAMQIELADRAT